MVNGISNRLSFSSRIAFISDNEFDDVVADISRNNPEQWIKRPWNRSITGPKVATDEANSCVAGGPVAPVVLSHYKPSQVENFNQIAPNLGITPDKSGGLLVGGQILGVGSNDLANNFESEFQEAGVPCSKFLGQRIPEAHTNLCYDENENTWFVNYRANGNATGVDPRSIKTSRDIRAAYSDTYVAPLDYVSIGYVPVDSAELNERDPRENFDEYNRFYIQPSPETTESMSEAYRRFFEGRDNNNS